MMASEIRELSSEEIREKLVELTEEVFNLRFQHATDQLENPMRLRHIRREIARMKTIMRGRQLASSREA
ncbi:MAG: 50S ribosomal protein L29 [Desulfobacterales bacterium]|nr:50S ribosomal protein L29 [Desulfobacterales bacterium]